MEKTNYIQLYKHQMPNIGIMRPVVFAYSYKVGSTSLIKKYVAKGYGGFANQRDLNLKDIITLYVRHPLDRLVSAWKWFTEYHNSYLKEILAASPEDHETILARNTKFEPWLDAALKYENLHWYGQKEYHTNEKGVFVPNNVFPLEAMSGERLKKTVHKEWRTYYSDDLRSRMEKLYADDLTLYNSVKEKKDGFDGGIT